MADRERYPSEAAERFQIRMSPGLRDRIRIAAEVNERSMNSEILATLEEKYAPTVVEEIKKRLEEIFEFLDQAEPGDIPAGMPAEFDALIKKLNSAKGIFG